MSQPETELNNGGSQPETEHSLLDIAGMMDESEQETEQEPGTDPEAPETEVETPGTEVETPEGEQEEPGKSKDDDDTWKAKKVKVSVQGQEHEITLEEATHGYMREQDYRRKTQEAAELTRAAQAERAQVKQELDNRVNSLNVLGAALYQEYVGDQAKLAGLLETDPHGYLRVKEQMAQRQNLLGQIEAHRQATQEYAINEQAKARVESLRLAEETLLERLPEWKDPGKRKAESTDIASLLVDAGYSHDELKELIDPRALIVARKAALWDKAQAAKAKATEVTKTPATPAKPVTPGTAVKPDKSASAVKAAQNYQRNPNSLDALAGLALERGI